MALNLREKYGVEYHNEKLGLTLWLHKENSFWKASHVIAWLNNHVPYNRDANKQNDYVANNFWNAFLVAEAFVLDFECANDDNPIAEYLKTRSKFDMESNLEQFQVCFSYDQAMVFNDAYAKTRPEIEESVESTEEEKKSLESTS